jgi:signal transduction histidine kinase
MADPAANQRADGPYRRRATWALPVGVFIAGVTLTATFYWGAREVIQLRDQSRFNNAVRITESTLKSRLDVYIGLLRAGAGFFATHQDLDEAAFHEFAGQINVEKNYPGAQALAYAHRVLPHEKDAFVERMRASGRPNFKITPEGDRALYVPIIYLEPMDRRNEHALGFDMFSEPVRREAMERARDEADAHASGRVTLVQEIDEEKQAGFLIYVPVYRGLGVPDTVAARRDRLQGFVYSPFRMNDLLHGIFGEERHPDLHFEIFDGPAVNLGRVLFRLATPSSEEPSYQTTSQLDVAGQTWTVVYRTTPSFDAASPRRWTDLVAAGGVMVSALLGAIMFALVRAEARATQRAVELREAVERYRSLGERQEQIVAERTAELRETNAQLEAFVYTIAHDLRAPLRAISGYAYLLEQDLNHALDDESRQRLGRMKASAALMDRLILDLIAFGRTARAEMELAPVDVQRAWLAALAQTSTQRDETGAQIETIGALPVVIGHEATLTQALANLLGNAMKFVAPGVVPKVTIRSEDLGDRVRLWVEDNGIGIPAAMQERAFRLFERLHGSQYGGTGIGLSIVRKGVERMGGHVGVVSEPDQGSRFWLEMKKA